MIPRRMFAGTGFRLVAKRLSPTPTTASSPKVTCCTHIFTTPLFAPPPGLRTYLTRHFHLSVANSMASPAETSSALASCPADSGSTSEDATATATAKEQGGEKQQKAEEPKLPPLKGADFRAYNRLAEHMDLFHEHFRSAWNTLWAAACAGNSAARGKRGGGRSVISEGLAFVSQLEVHHSIEETYVFPVLARRMPEFRADGKGGKNAAELLRQHREIHHGMEGFQKYLRACRDGEQDLDIDKLKAQIEG
ncbi:hypothetical protein GGR54DRAFT_618819 [Hypoxylon sp. NC1633]|nr:hypothetical protein GGR54DRAFT_618819 [Hypoxylon sp. NC1633]